MAPIVDNKPKEGERGPDDLFQASKEQSFRGFSIVRKEAARMPRKPRRPCRHPGCPNLCEDGEQYCEKHRKEAERQYKHFTRGYSAGKRYGRQWKKIRDR